MTSGMNHTNTLTSSKGSQLFVKQRHSIKRKSGVPSPFALNKQRFKSFQTELRTNEICVTKIENKKDIRTLMMDRNSFKFKEFEEAISDETFKYPFTMLVSDPEEATSFWEQFLDSFNACVDYIWLLTESSNSKLKLSILNKLWKMILITEKLNKITIECDCPEKSHNGSKDLIPNRMISKERSDSRMIFNASSKRFPALLASEPSAMNINLDTNLGFYDIDDFDLSSWVWDNVFEVFYSMKYEIFLKTFELVHSQKLPFSDNGTCFNSKNMKWAFRVSNNKIQLRNYLAITDFLSISEIISMFCLDKTGDYRSVDDLFTSSFKHPNAYVFKLKVYNSSEDHSVNLDAKWRTLFYLLLGKKLAHIDFISRVKFIKKSKSYWFTV